MSATIQDLIGFARGMGERDQKNFEGLVLTIQKAEPPQDGQYGSMQRVQARDATGSRWFSVMDCPELGQGQQVIASGRLKGGPKGAYWNILSIQPADAGAAPAPPQRAGSPPRQQQSVPPPQGRATKTLDECDAFIRAALDKSEAWPLTEEQPRQALVTTLLIAWLRGEVEASPPYYQDAGAPDDDGVGF